MLERIYQKLSSLFPKKAVNQTAELIVQGGFDEINARTYLGFTLFFSFALGMMVFIIANLVLAQTFLPLLIAAALVFVASGSFYVLLISTAINRAHEIEKVLPDALMIISSNIRAGMTLENAIWSSARPEFGPFKDEIKKISADSFGGVTLKETLEKSTKRVRSKLYSRTVKLINEGISLGGEMSKLLQEVAEYVRANNQMQKEIAASTTSYAMFIIFSAVIAAPVLFSVSVFYTELNESFLSKTSTQQNFSQKGGSNPGLLSLPGFSGSTKPAITSEQLNFFALATIIMTNFFASLTIGLVRTGKTLNGMKYAPPLVLVALTLFFASHVLLQTLLGGLLK